MSAIRIPQYTKVWFHRGSNVLARVLVRRLLFSLLSGNRNTLAYGHRGEPSDLGLRPVADTTVTRSCSAGMSKYTFSCERNYIFTTANKYTIIMYQDPENGWRWTQSVISIIWLKRSRNKIKLPVFGLSRWCCGGCVARSGGENAYQVSQVTSPKRSASRIHPWFQCTLLNNNYKILTPTLNKYLNSFIKNIIRRLLSKQIIIYLIYVCIYLDNLTEWSQSLVTNICIRQMNWTSKKRGRLENLLALFRWLCLSSSIFRILVHSSEVHLIHNFFYWKTKKNAKQ